MEYKLGTNLDLIVYGSLNMDYVGYVKKLPSSGETIASDSFHIGPGGKAANQAVAATKLTAKTAMVGRIGDDHTGELMKSKLKEFNVDDENIQITPNCQTGIAMVSVNPKGENTIVTYKGANECLSKDDINKSEEKLKQAQGAILQLEMDKQVSEYIIQKVSNLGKKVILNLAPIVEIETNVLKLVDLLIVNETEASYLSGIEVSSVETAKTAANIISKLGIRNVVVTLGSNGAVFKDENLIKHYSAPTVNVVDSTAAGDCFVAAVSVFWLKSGDLDHAVRNAVNVSALAVTKKGAQASLPTLQEYKDFEEKLKQTNIYG